MAWGTWNSGPRDVYGGSTLEELIGQQGGGQSQTPATQMPPFMQQAASNQQKSSYSYNKTKNITPQAEAPVYQSTVGTLMNAPIETPQMQQFYRTAINQALGQGNEQISAAMAEAGMGRGAGGQAPGVGEQKRLELGVDLQVPYLQALMGAAATRQGQQFQAGMERYGRLTAPESIGESFGLDTRPIGFGTTGLSQTEINKRSAGGGWPAEWDSGVNVRVPSGGGGGGSTGSPSQSGSTAGGWDSGVNQGDYPAGGVADSWDFGYGSGAWGGRIGDGGLNVGDRMGAIGTDYPSAGDYEYTTGRDGNTYRRRTDLTGYENPWVLSDGGG